MTNKYDKQILKQNKKCLYDKRKVTKHMKLTIEDKVLVKQSKQNKSTVADHGGDECVL